MHILQGGHMNYEKISSQLARHMEGLLSRHSIPVFISVYSKELENPAIATAFKRLRLPWTEKEKKHAGVRTRLTRKQIDWLSNKPWIFILGYDDLARSSLS